MPTGYTNIIEDNEAEPTFEAFALRCARGMGVSIHQRDEGLDSPLRAPAADSYHLKEIEKAQAELERVRELSDEELRVAIAEANRKRAEQSEELRKVRERRRSRYARMLAKVEAWKPPTPEHEGLRRFMREQIDLCYQPNEEPYEIPEGPQTPPAYRLKLIESAVRNLAYHRESHEKEVAHARDAAKWIEVLRASLAEYGK